jgi:hypothetical protein
MSPPSPAQRTVGRPGRASAAPIAGPRPAPIAPASATSLLGHGRQTIEELGRDRRGLAEDADVDGVVGARQARVALDLDDRRVPEQRLPGRGEVAEARPHGQHEVDLPEQALRPGACEPAHDAEVVRLTEEEIARRKRGAEQSPGPSRQLDELRGRRARHRSSTGQDERLRSLQEEVGHLTERLGVRLGIRRP